MWRFSANFNVERRRAPSCEWFGGSRGYSDELAWRLPRRHQHRYISLEGGRGLVECDLSRWLARPRCRRRKPIGASACTDREASDSQSRDGPLMLFANPATRSGDAAQVHSVNTSERRRQRTCGRSRSRNALEQDLVARKPAAGTTSCTLVQVARPIATAGEDS